MTIYITELQRQKFKPTYLMIKQHKVTGLKYLCKTNTKDPIKYNGSGVYWGRHRKKHGENIDTVWIHLFDDIDKLVATALSLSELFDIVHSESWANLKPENGLDGGDTLSYKSEKDMELISGKISSAISGSNNGMFGKPCYYNMTEEEKQQWKNNIGEGSKNKIVTDITRKKMSENSARYWAGKSPWNKGKTGVQPKSLETKMKISIPVTFRGVEYYSLSDAVDKTGITGFKIKKELFGDGMSSLKTLIAKYPNYATTK